MSNHHRSVPSSPAPERPATFAPGGATPDERTPHTASPTVRVHWSWVGIWAILTTFAVFEVVKHGYVNGTSADAAVLTVAAIAAFIAPDLTFLIGLGQPAPAGSLPRAAVPWYNTMHRMWIPFGLTTIIGVAFAPLSLLSLAAFVGGLSWMAHIALDRAAGYGLRASDGSHTHA